MTAEQFFSFFDAHPWAWAPFAMVVWVVFTGAASVVYDRFVPRSDEDWATFMVARPALGGAISLMRTAGFNVPGALRAFRVLLGGAPPSWLTQGPPRLVVSKLVAAEKALTIPPNPPPSSQEGRMVEVATGLNKALDGLASGKPVDPDMVAVVEPSKPTTMRAAMLAFAFLLTGCGGALRGAAEVANYAAQAGNEAQSIVHDKCTLPMVAIAAEPATPERVLKAKALAANCDKIEDAYDALRRGHMALVSAIVAAQSDRGVTVGELIAITDSVAQSLITVEKAIRAQSIAAKESSK